VHLRRECGKRLFNGTYALVGVLHYVLAPEVDDMPAAFRELGIHFLVALHVALDLRQPVIWMVRVLELLLEALVLLALKPSVESLPVEELRVHKDAEPVFRHNDIRRARKLPEILAVAIAPVPELLPEQDLWLRILPMDL
jgi:hypothetical protein